ncbi:hypothetical protein V2U94_24365 [Paenibacillus polymyxa]|uniref:hypothetical protein n=1 Tax=Paenibacillus polymyxa TaxID=1406 RepID=UPI002ED13141|nr:hypothetical protein [Paenibacillus polymyxa]
MFKLDNYQDFSPTEVCAMLTIKACPKSMFPRLEFDDNFRKDVEGRLEQVGYELVDDRLSHHFDARLKQTVRLSGPFTEGAFLPGDGLSVICKALLVILWCNLILPKYDTDLKKQLNEEPHLTEEQLFENFKSQLGSMQNLRKNLTFLKQQGFIQGIRGKSSIIAGPRLSTAIDNSRLYEHIRKNVNELLIEETKYVHEKTSDQILQAKTKGKEADNREQILG